MMHDKSIAELIATRRAGELSSRQLTDHFLSRIDQYEPDLNTLITRTDDSARAQAEQLDENPVTGLAGLPIVHKDLFCTRGVKTSCASRMLDNFVAPYDATLVTGLQEAGAVTLGKANMDEFAMGSSNESSFYGAVRNPWHSEHVPGGSSGGSAAAVAAGLVPAATGSDTGGSIRQPAAYCGITGIKPTYGRVSRYGMIAFASSLDQAGCLARSAEDCAHVLAAMAGFDVHDSTSVDLPVPDYPAQLTGDVSGLRIGLPREYFDQGLQPQVREAVKAAVRELEKLGAAVVEISMPLTEMAVPVYYALAPAEAASNLARFDGVRYGYRCNDPMDLTDLYQRSRAEGFGEEVKRRLMMGTYTLSADCYDIYYRKAQQTRRLISQEFQNAFEQVDLLATPVTQTPAFQLGEKNDDPLAMYFSDAYTLPSSLAGVPGMSIPAGFVDGLPVGLQLLAPWFEETRLLDAGHAYQQVTDWHKCRPAGFEQESA